MNLGRTGYRGRENGDSRRRVPRDLLEDLVGHEVVSVDPSTARVLLESVHIRRLLDRAEDGLGLVRNTVGEVGANEAMVRIVEVDGVVILCVLDHLEAKADTLRVPIHHVVWRLDVVKELLLRAIGLELVIGHKRNRCCLDHFLGQGLVVFLDVFFYIVAVLYHGDDRARLLGDGPRGLPDALIWHKVDWTHPVGSHFIVVPHAWEVDIVIPSLLTVSVLIDGLIIVFFIYFNWICAVKTRLTRNGILTLARPVAGEAFDRQVLPWMDWWTRGVASILHERSRHAVHVIRVPLPGVLLIRQPRERRMLVLLKTGKVSLLDRDLGPEPDNDAHECGGQEEFDDSTEPLAFPYNEIFATERLEMSAYFRHAASGKYFFVSPILYSAAAAAPAWKRRK